MSSLTTVDEFAKRKLLIEDLRKEAQKLRGTPESPKYANTLGDRAEVIAAQLSSSIWMPYWSVRATELMEKGERMLMELKRSSVVLNSK